MPKTTLKTATKKQVAETLKTVNRKDIPVLPVDPELFLLKDELRYVP